ncbi:MAG TPA: sulfurtransferase [Polyangiaceae bacterium]|nr:sulfurtransferase [Polyangiaceae bacterium]
MGTVLSAEELSAWLAAGEEVVLVDCRFALAEPSAGERAYRDGHLPGAFFLDIERDLSSEVVAGMTGRHPLPHLDEVASKLGRIGVGPGVRVVAYDQDNGMFAARLWWLCRFLGHGDVWVLDGGVNEWVKGGRPLQVEVPSGRPRDFSTLYLHPESIVAADEVESMVENPDARLFDARSAERFRGENETIDPVAGHIPGARSLPFADSLEGGRFRSPEQLRARFEAALAGRSSEEAVAYCGSGITACHLILAAEHAGLPGIRLYPGSWSEWIVEPSRPVATGA